MSACKQWLKTCSWVCFFVHNEHSYEFEIFHLLWFELLARCITKYLRQNNNNNNNNNSNEGIRGGFTVIYHKLYGLIIYTGKIVQQSVAWFFNSGWHDSLTVTGIILQQSLARVFNTGWHDCSIVTGIIIQQSLVRFFNTGWDNSSTVTGKIFSFFYASRILQQWRSLLKNCGKYQE